MCQPVTVEVGNMPNHKDEVQLPHPLTEDAIFEFIKDRALRLWHDAGKPQGNDWEFWFQAESEVKKQLNKLGK